MKTYVIILTNGEVIFDDFSESINEARRDAYAQPQWKGMIKTVMTYSAWLKTR